MKRLLPIIAIFLILSGCKKEKPFTIYNNVYYSVSNPDKKMTGMVLEIMPEHDDMRVSQLCEYGSGEFSLSRDRFNCADFIRYTIRPAKDGKFEVHFKGFTASGPVGHIPKNTDINETVIIDPHSADQGFTMLGYEFKRYFGEGGKYSH